MSEKKWSTDQCIYRLTVGVFVACSEPYHEVKGRAVLDRARFGVVCRCLESEHATSGRMSTLFPLRNPFFSNVDDQGPATNQELRLHDSVNIFQNRSDNSLAEGILLFCLNRKVFGSLRCLNLLPLKLSDIKLP